ncbi:unnamed protein product, partial [Meganyctiphanes norvegica]
GHSVSVGSCPRTPPVPSADFKLNKLMGTWYVIEVFGRQSKCFTLTFNKVSDDTLTISEGKEFYLLDKINMDYAYTNTGTLNIEDPANPAKMRVRWPDNIAGSATFTIMDTDFDNYLLFVECQKLFFISRSNAAILSRNNTLDPAIIENLKAKVDATGLDSEDFSSQNHEKCLKPGESDSDITSIVDDIKENIFGLVPDEQLDKIKDEEELAQVISFDKGPGASPKSWSYSRDNGQLDPYENR